MKKQQYMIILVQTICLRKDITQNRAIAERVIYPLILLHPMFFEIYFSGGKYDMDLAAEEYCNWQYQMTGCEEPKWYKKAKKYKANILRIR